MMTKTPRNSTKPHNSNLSLTDNSRCCKATDQDFSVMQQQHRRLTTMLNNHQSLNTVLHTWHSYIAAQCEQTRLLNLAPVPPAQQPS